MLKALTWKRIPRLSLHEDSGSILFGYDTQLLEVVERFIGFQLRSLDGGFVYDRS